MNALGAETHDANAGRDVPSCLNPRRRSSMARASVPAWRSGRAVVLLLGLAVVGLLASRTLTGAAPTPPTGNDVQDVTRLINEKLEAGYKANNITPAGKCTDYEFIRRATLDIIGRIAT